ncbi:hypothetical protein GA0115249_10951, partial [Streptomyces sp. PpalLS-921]
MDGVGGSERACGEEKTTGTSRQPAA